MSKGIIVKGEVSKFKYILNGVTKEVLLRATVTSTNRTAVALRAQAARKMKERYNLPIGGSSKGGSGTTPPGIKSGIIVERARGGKGKTVNDIFAVLRTSNKPISMIHFVRGDKAPAQLRGVPVKRRKMLKVAVTRGNVRALPKAFILKSHGSVQVFKRPNGIYKKQSVPSLWHLLEKPEVKQGLQIFGAQKYDEEMGRNVAYYMQQLAAQVK